MNQKTEKKSMEKNKTTEQNKIIEQNNIINQQTDLNHNQGIEAQTNQNNLIIANKGQVPQDEDVK